MAKKRKKKVYTTPKKIKNTRTKISIDKFINSFNNPKCKTCNSTLAIHNNRFCCGKCKTSLEINK